MNIPAHLEPLRRSLLMDTCQRCRAEVTDLQETATPLDRDGKPNGPTVAHWVCWRCQGCKEITLHKQCEGCAAWFVGTAKTKRCGHGAQCQEQPA